MLLAGVEPASKGWETFYTCHIQEQQKSEKTSNSYNKKRNHRVPLFIIYSHPQEDRKVSLRLYSLLIADKFL